MNLILYISKFLFLMHPLNDCTDLGAYRKELAVKYSVKSLDHDSRLNTGNLPLKNNKHGQNGGARSE